MRYHTLLEKTLAVILLVEIAMPAPVARAIPSDSSTVLSDRGLSPAAGAAPAVADPYTGGATYAYPFDLPPGTGGLTPELGLRYHSGSRADGWVGYGWSLGTSSITRSMKKGVPSYTDTDVFELDGQELVPESSTPELPRTYHTRRESFLRIVHEADGSWAVTDKGGIRGRLGITSETRIENSAVFLPGQPGVIDPLNSPFQWLLAEQDDPHGNVVQLSYDRQDPGIAYPATIRYGLRRLSGGGVSSPNDSVDRVVSFTLEAAERPDAPINYAAGFERRLGHRLHHVDVTAGGALLRRYGLVYLESPDSARSLLQSVEQSGSDGAAQTPTAPLVTSFSYRTNADPQNDRRGWETASAFSWPAQLSLVSADRRETGVRLGDVDGDGRVDLMKAFATFSGNQYLRTGDSGVYLNNGAGFESTTSTEHPLPAVQGQIDAATASFGFDFGYGPQSTSATALDLTADGRIDIAGGMVYVNQPTGTPTLAYGHFHQNTGSGFTALGDAPGGYGDLLDHTASGVLLWNLGRLSILDPYYVVSTLYYQFGSLPGNSRFADLDGDGLPELVVRGVSWDEKWTGWAPPYASGTMQSCAWSLSSIFFHNRNNLVFETSNYTESSVSTTWCSTDPRTYLSDDYLLCDPSAPSCQRRLLFNESRSLRYVSSGVSSWFVHWEMGNELIDLNADGLDDAISGSYDSVLGDGINAASLNNGWRGYAGANAWAFPTKPGSSPAEPVRFYTITQDFSRDEGLRLADVNGDGRVDALQAVEGSSATTWLNDGDVNEPSNPSPWNAAPAWQLPSGLAFVNAQGQDLGVRLADLDGDGMTDLVRSNGSTNEVYLNKGEVPDLLETVTSPLGGQTTFGYTPSTSFPGADGISHAYLPQILQVVSAITVFDGVTSTTSSVFYKGGLFDPVSRELRGFREVTTTRSDGRKTVAYFYQDEPKAGLVERKELRDAAGAVWLTTEHRYTADADGPPFISLPSLEIVTESDPQTTARTTGSALLYDAFGNQTARTDYGVVSFDGSQVTDAVASDTRTLAREYAVPSSPAGAPAYIVDRVKREKLLAGTAASGTVLREKHFYYDSQGSLDAIPTRGLLTKQVAISAPGTGSSGPTATYTYDAYGNLLTERGPRANAGEAVGDTTIAYEGTFHSFPVSITNPAGHVRTLGYAPAAGCAFAYPAGAGIAQTERPANLPASPPADAIRRCFDVFGRLVSERAPSDLAESQLSYSIPGRSIVRSDRTSAVGAAPTWRTESTFLDALGRPTATSRSGPQGSTISTSRTYDALGRLASETLPSQQAITYDYDVRDRVRHRTLPGGRTTETGYAPGVVTVTDPNLHATTQSLDAFGQVLAVTDGSGMTTYAYQLSGELTNVVDSTTANQAVIFYDSLGRRTSLYDPDTGTTQFTAYDDAGNLRSRTDARGKVTSFTYDALDRTLTRSYVTETGGPAEDRFTYDTAPYGKGSLATREDAAGKLVVLGYDALGRIFGEQQIAGGRQLIFVTTYDGLGQAALKIYPATPASHTLVWSRDAAGYLTSIGTQGGAAYASSIQWDEFGRLTDWTAGNGAVTTQRYDTVTSRLSETKVAQGGTTHEWLGYGYDVGDLVRTIDDLRPAGLASRSFSYDALDRLTEATGPFLPGFASTSLHYGFDAIGNLQCKDASVLAGCAGGTQMLYPAAGQPRPHAPTLVYPASQGPPPALIPGYDAAGNLIALGTRAYAYDGLGRMTTAREGGGILATHTYDAGDRRVREDDRSGSRSVTRHFVRPDFEWDATRKLGHIHVSLGGMNVATQVEPCDPPAATAGMLPAVSLDSERTPREALLAVVATPALLGALLLLLQLALLRRRAHPLLRPALAGATALAFYLSLASPALGLPSGDVNADGHLDAADALLVHQISAGTKIPTADELERADIAPLNQTPETTEPRVHPGDEALLWRALHGDDVDGDQLTPDQELALGASPFRLDSDQDGVPDNVEFQNGTALDDADTDGDGFSDSEEAAAGTDPRKGVIYRHGDHLGSTVLVTKATGTGTALVLERAVYLPFGGRVAASAGASTKAPEFGFTGQRYDNASNVYDYGARWYDPALGRFLQPDSIVPSPYASQSLNRYSYVRNNPLSRIDPGGNWDFDFGGMVGEWVGGLFGGIGSMVGRIGGGLVAGLIPGPGEVADAGILFDSREASGDRWMAAGSLGLSILTLGLSPNFASGGRELIERWDDFSRVGGDALSRFTPNEIFPTHGTWGSDVSALFDDAASGMLDMGAARGVPEKLYHYGFARDADSILKNGLRPGGFTTSRGDLSPLQAQIDLALSPNRGLRDALFEIDVPTLRRMGVDVPPGTRIGRDFNMPGGEIEHVFDVRAPAEAIRRIR